jgi:hypothetical protein
MLESELEAGALLVGAGLSGAGASWELLGSALGAGESVGTPVGEVSSSAGEAEARVVLLSEDVDEGAGQLLLLLRWVRFSGISGNKRDFLKWREFNILSCRGERFLVSTWLAFALGAARTVSTTKMVERLNIML